MRLSFCPFTLALFVVSAFVVADNMRKKRNESDKGSISDAANSDLPPCQVVFVLGAPGTGKGTQCQLATERFQGWSHLSAGDLLRAERNKESGDTKLKDIINECISSGKLVPSEVTCQLILNAMAAEYKLNSTTKFLIDGFPRSFGNATAWDNLQNKHIVECVLNFECPEEVLVGRLLARGKSSGRVDDLNVTVIRKRFHTHVTETAPVVKQYESQGKLINIPADRPVQDVYAQVEAVLKSI